MINILNLFLPLFDYPETSKKIKNSNNFVTTTIKGASCLYNYFLGDVLENGKNFRKKCRNFKIRKINKQ